MIFISQCGKMNSLLLPKEYFVKSTLYIFLYFHEILAKIAWRQISEISTLCMVFYAWNQRIHCFFKEFFFSFSWSKNKFFAFSHCAKRKLYILWKLRKFTLIFFSNFWIKKLLNSWFDEYFLGESKFFIFSHCDRVLTNFAFSNHFSFF